ncbi:MAG: hypothetical protein QHD01_09595 [Bradyrhizobium sp.]|uniref:type II CRISPR RNA-guided endonuclease Cas9 n=1 Tax=Bradyrhizobium sp. TaxID=376 RepID=UPI0029AED779|nr:type II CRISPR RNA-guided endonuclease Cas9 [Bradyrhizobium sp.]MDX3966838.1 hypothetical protein [Bradyrhizobium sp.]
MERIFGFDIGTTSIGFAVIDYNPEEKAGNILRMGVRIFPEARDPDGTPLNQQRRQKRMMRRQLRRRRQRRKALNEALHEAGFLPSFSKEKKSDWETVMTADPYDLRRRGLDEALTLHEVGRALYHLSQQRHFKGRDLEETEAQDTDETKEPEKDDAKDADEKKSKAASEATHQKLKAEDKTLGALRERLRYHRRVTPRPGTRSDRRTAAVSFTD